MNTFREYIEKRFFIEQGIGAPGTLPPGGPGAPGGPGGAPGGPPGGPPGLGGLGGPPGGGLGGPPGGGLGGGMGGAPGGDLSGKKPLELKPLDVWSVLERILGLKEEEPKNKQPENTKQPKHLNS